MSQQKLLDCITNICRDKNVLIKSETLLFKGKVLDSMNILDLIGYIEKQIGRRLTDNEITASNFESIEKIEKIFFNKDEK